MQQHMLQELACLKATSSQTTNSQTDPIRQNWANPQPTVKKTATIRDFQTKSKPHSTILLCTHTICKRVTTWSDMQTLITSTERNWGRKLSTRHWRAVVVEASWRRKRRAWRSHRSRECRRRSSRNRKANWCFPGKPFSRKMVNFPGSGGG